MGWFEPDKQKYRNLASAWVLPAPGRCVQCGVCSFHCPMEIDVRRHVWFGQPVYDSHCLTCGECVERCPRGLLRFQPLGSAMPVYQPTEARDERETAGRRNGERVGDEAGGGARTAGERDRAGRTGGERDDELDPAGAAR